jgi:hypothetical protein
LGSQTAVDWSTSFYQYTNRLAHLYFLRALNHIPAYLVFIYFINDLETGGPKSKEAWEASLKVLPTRLGLKEHRLSPYILECFEDLPSPKSSV